MFQHHNAAFEQQVTIIHPGEYLATKDDIIISTVLGSCISIAFRDEEAGMGGLNHFMLPGSFYRQDAKPSPEDFLSEDAKYGMYAMELLINDLLKMGCRKSRLTAKIFGGARVLISADDTRKSVAEGNIEFAKEYLETEHIPILASDLGGHEARKIFFFVKSGKVLMKRISGTLKTLVEREEASYRNRIRQRPGSGDVVLFDT